MSSAREALLAGAITVTLAGAVGYGLFRIISPKNEVANPLRLGRKWFAWTAMIVSFATLPSFFRLFDANSIAMWLLGIALFGGLAFGFGWLYGRFFKFNTAHNGNSSGPDETGPQATNGTKASSSEPRTYYHNLQVAENASPEVIKGAYKYLAQKWHPDRNPDNFAEAERITRLINGAYVVLSDPQLRKEHDQWIRTEREKARPHSYPDRSQQSWSVTSISASAPRPRHQASFLKRAWLVLLFATGTIMLLGIVYQVFFGEWRWTYMAALLFWIAVGYYAYRALFYPEEIAFERDQEAKKRLSIKPNLIKGATWGASAGAIAWLFLSLAVDGNPPSLESALFFLIAGALVGAWALKQ